MRSLHLMPDVSAALAKRSKRALLANGLLGIFACYELSAVTNCRGCYELSPVTNCRPAPEILMV